MGVSELYDLYLSQRRGPPAVKRKLHHYCVVEDGYYVDPTTGIVEGRVLELDRNINGQYSPLYYYNRSWRFIGLFNMYEIGFRDQNATLKCFEELEKAWEKVKGNYTRVYFLTQKLLLQEICTRLNIKSTQPPKRPISDLRRYKAQIAIFNDLWSIYIS